MIASGALHGPTTVYMRQLNIMVPKADRRITRVMNCMKRGSIVGIMATAGGMSTSTNGEPAATGTIATTIAMTAGRQVLGGGPPLRRPP